MVPTRSHSRHITHAGAHPRGGGALGAKAPPKTEQT
jgi:hypothetical protein